MQMKKVLAAAMALCMTAGAIGYTAAPILTPVITAQAADADGSCYSFDEETGVLTLKGNVDRDTIYNFSNKRNVKKIIAEEGTVFPEDCSKLFYMYQKCGTMDLSNADTSKVTDMSQMFACCSGMTSLDISCFDTSNVTDMSLMFVECQSLMTLDITGINTSKVTNMGAMFSGCKRLNNLSLNGIDTSNVTAMDLMFSGCTNLYDLDLSGINTGKVKYMSKMFYGCTALKTLDLSRFNTSKVTNMEQMFAGCNKLTSVDLSSFDTSSVTKMGSMFDTCPALKKLDVSNFDTHNVTSMGGMFSSCKSLTELDVSGFDTSNVTGMGGMFGSCSGLTELDVSNFDTSNVTGMGGMFSDCSGLTELDIRNFDTSNVTGMGSMFSGCTGLTELDLSNLDTSNVTSMGSMFSGCTGFTQIDVSGFDTTKVTDMCAMFRDCTGLTKLDLSNFDTSNVQDMNNMFNGCSGLTSLDLSNFDTGNVTRMNYMFDGCSNLTELNISGFDTGKVKDMYRMFENCSSMTSFDLSSFNTGNALNMYNMFAGCSSLASLDLSSFDTSNVTDMDNMFSGCSRLTSIDLSSFDTSKVKYINNMFSDCSNLTYLDLSGFDMSNITNMASMFSDCSSLKTLTLGENFKSIDDTAKLPNNIGWVNSKAPSAIISGDGEYAVIENEGKNTYKLFGTATENKPTYPTNIRVEYSEKYRQVRFRWDKVEGADRYGIAVYLAGKWRVQKQDITDTVYTSPKNLTPGKTYKVAIAARVNGKWDTKNAIKNAVTVTIKGNNSYVKPDIEVRYGSDLYVIADEIPLYLGPDTSYGKVTTIPQKTSLQELGVMNNNDNWAFTEYKGQYGWVQIENELGYRQIQISSIMVKKPVIYLYPEKETDVHIEVELTEAELSTTYPKYNNGWDVVAKPDGSLVNKADGSRHRYLFWDAVNSRTQFDFSKGFCVAGSDTESFLKEKLSYMGLTEDEMNEFIVYWLPLMEHNKYNLISFQSDKYTDSAKLNITPEPDSMLRVFMTYVPLEEAVDIEPQELSTFERSGFTVVEWGGSEIK